MKRIIHAVFFWIFSLGVMYVIFKFSCQTGEQSAEVSQNLLDVIIEYLGKILTENVLRKLAHFSEFAALGFFMSGAVYFTFNKNKYYISIIPCALYAVSDEIHQYFVPERACQLFDMFIDTCGSSLGFIIFTIFILIYSKRKRTVAVL